MSAVLGVCAVGFPLGLLLLLDQLAEHCPAFGAFMDRLF